jgi:hypothetical protein
MRWRCPPGRRRSASGDGEACGITGHGKRGPAVRPIARTPHDPEPSGQLADRALWQGVASKARCADGALDPEEWFPASLHEERARREAAARSPSACPARYAPSTWNCRCGTGVSASAASGAALSLLSVRLCAGSGSGARASVARHCPSRLPPRTDRPQPDHSASSPPTGTTAPVTLVSSPASHTSAAAISSGPSSRRTGCCAADDSARQAVQPCAPGQDRRVR